MEVRIDKRYPVAASADRAWAVLRDIRATAACMPGASITEQTDATHYKGSVRSKVGPAVMAFGGEIEVQTLDEAARAMQMTAKGADKSGSSASMNLDARIEPGDSEAASVLAGNATIHVSGKLAQFGNRLLVPVAEQMLAQFAANFGKAAAALPAPAAASTGSGTLAGAEPAGALEDRLPGGDAGPSTDAAAATDAADMHAAGGPPPGPSPATPPRASSPPPPSVAPPAAAPSPAAGPPSELNALGLLWAVFKSWLAKRFGRGDPR